MNKTTAGANPAATATTAAATAAATAATATTAATAEEAADLIGDTTFFNFFCAVLSRIAYIEDPLTLFICSDVIKIFTQPVLERFCVDTTAELKNDDTLFELSTNPLNLPIRLYKGKRYVNFISYAEKVNSLIDETTTSPYYSGKTNTNLSIISIADSNYGDTLIFGMSFLNIVFTAFRGTYSAKTAQSYTQLSSLTPKPIDKYGDLGLGGVAKIELETAKTTLNAILETANELFAKINKKVIMAVTGHSLGGAMATLKTFELLRNDKDKMDAAASNKENPFFCINPIPICVTFGAPRVLGKNTNATLCGWITNKQLFFTRCSNHGDPVTSMPSASLGYYHPCSDKSNESQVTTKLSVLEECDSPVSVIQGAHKLANGDLPVTVVYTKAMNCINVLPKSLTSGTNASDHVVYLYVSFTTAANAKQLALSALSSVEIARIDNTTDFSDDISITKGNTTLRLIFMQGNSQSGIYREVFLDLKNLEIPILETKTTLSAPYNIDNYDNSVVFDMLSKNAKNISVQMKTYNTKILGGIITKDIPIPFPKTGQNVIDSNSFYDKLISSERSTAKSPNTIFNPKATSPKKSSIFGMFTSKPKSPVPAQGGKKTKKRRKIIKKKKRISKRHKKRRISRKYKKQKSKYTVTKSCKRLIN
jgi:hypothetical protein